MIPAQPGPSDAPDARAARDGALDRVERAASEQEIERLLDAVFVTGASMREFTTDDVLEVLGGWLPREPRLLGAVMVKAAKFGWVTRTGQHRESARRVSHARPKRVWASQLYLEPELRDLSQGVRAPEEIDTYPLF